ncbi:PTS system mannose/fructose/sorbose family transporter subunit IID [Psittacicella hinzii]|uniref:PTS N-acetylgalactosamine transporter subunit IID n=1 Tax=Psittacicella hinzii TaxID=2028575 RepID=A0A3A1YS85_9GAMM|nr:PTS system mannose/fructose/sorbose family transporter subunit IID [Psittacicella hinzii]RIY39244.1 PTS N-acetylgalactosamine transporter subunit IID [Psittacicella hinzii]
MESNKKLNKDLASEEQVFSDTRDVYDDAEVRKVITKKDLWICAIRGLFMEGNFNYERMQAGGWAYSIIPALKKIHTNDRDLAVSLKNHLQFFNASPKFFTFLLGAAVAMEENKEKPSTVNVMKVAGMGPCGGIGDAIDHSILFPLTLALGASIALETQSIIGALLYFVLYQTYHFFVYFGLMFLGYSAGTSAMENLGGQTERLARAANIMGVFVIGALTATFIRIKTVYEYKIVGEDGAERIISLQAFLDKILPNLLPLALLFLMMRLIKGKGFWAKPPVLIFAVLIFGTLGHIVGIF